MFKLSNLRKESSGGWTYLKCDFEVSGRGSPFTEDSLWLAVKDEDSAMVADNVYDPFVLVPVMLGMYLGHDVRIEGNVSPKLYHNMKHYIMNIFDRFSDFTHPVNFEVSGFDAVLQDRDSLVGTGISCGVDSLTTIYDNYIAEDDERFRISSLFFFNVGTHGRFDNPRSEELFFNRAELNRKAADELGLPLHLVNSNFHAFTEQAGVYPKSDVGVTAVIAYLSMYSCALALQKRVRRWLAAGNLSYDEIMDNRALSRDFDIAEYCETFMPHLVSTECFELVIDGNTYSRAEKIERISEWPIAQKYLNVCSKAEKYDGHNCSCCEKCMWALIPLEAMGKLENFSESFDVSLYRRVSYRWKIKFVANEGRDSMETSLLRYARGKGLRMPPKLFSKIVAGGYRLKKAMREDG